LNRTVIEKDDKKKKYENMSKWDELFIMAKEMPKKVNKDKNEVEFDK
jgi:hypothetical protein